MSATVLPFKRPPVRRRETTVNGKRVVVGFACSLQARPDAVFLVTDDVDFAWCMSAWNRLRI